MHVTKENHLEKPGGSWNPYPSTCYEGEVLGEAFAGAGILILVHFMKENYLEKLCGSWNPYPYPSAFYEGELPGEALRELQSLS